MNHPICPPAPVITEEQHRIAWLTRCLKDIVWEYLLRMNMCRKGQFDYPGAPFKQTGAEIFEETTKHLLSELFDHEKEDGDKEPWERMIPYEKFKASAIEDLASEHCGDCTAVACSCSRCHIEELYGLPDSRTWRNKSEGWKLLNEYRNMQKEAEVKAPSE